MARSGSQIETPMTAADEQTLTAQAVAGSSTAFIALVRTHHQALRPMVFRIVEDHARLDDVMQDVYLKAFRAIGSFDQRSSFRTWLFRIAYNAAIDNKRRTSKIVPLHAEDMEAHTPPARDDVETSIQNQDLATALRSLTPEQRAVVLLVDAQGFDYSTVAEIVGIPRGTVSSRLTHARSALRKALGDYTKETER
jgi:RNA polymerase sigma-70 factor (ECF subfamily)